MPQASASLGANGFLGFGGQSQEGSELASGTPGRWMVYWWGLSLIWLLFVWRAVEGY